MRSFSMMLVVIAFPIVLNGDDAVQKELKALQGTWKAVALEANGNPFPKNAVPSFTYTVSADGKATGKMGNSEYTATMTVDPSKNPRTMENQHQSGPNKGKTQYAIYKLEGDKWTVCITAPGAAESNRPKDFNTKNSTNVVFIFEKVKENK